MVKQSDKFFIRVLVQQKTLFLRLLHDAFFPLAEASPNLGLK